MSLEINNRFSPAWPSPDTANSTIYGQASSLNRTSVDAAANADSGAEVNYGITAPSSQQAGAAQVNNQNTDNRDFTTQALQILAAILMMLLKPFQQNSQGPNGSSADTTGPVTGAGEIQTSLAQAALPPIPQGAKESPGIAAAPSQAQTLASNAAPQVPNSDGSNMGSGPYALNITNTQDHPITLGIFDKDNTLTSTMTLQPGQTGQGKYEANTTGLVKQADSKGVFQNNASRLEFYNGYVNTSYIDGRNAAIHATDSKGFEIGDAKSIADQAPAEIVTKDSAGDSTIAGYYDGSTAIMTEGANYMIRKLGQSTGMSYFHPDDDTQSQGKNPMRHTDLKSLDVTFGKA